MESVSDFEVGQRVELHPATDAWARGERYGNVVHVGRKYVHVLTDYNNVRKLTPRNILGIVTGAHPEANNA